MLPTAQRLYIFICLESLKVLQILNVPFLNLRSPTIWSFPVSAHNWLHKKLRVFFL